MAHLRTVHIRIDGRVQGVGYRAWVRARALEFGLTGWVRNRRDGAVEAVLQGPLDVVENMLRACEDGPRDAAVTAVEIVGEGVGAYSEFEVKATV